MILAIRFLVCLLPILPLRAEPGRYADMASEMTADIQSQYWMPERKLYRAKPGRNDPEMIWGGGVLFSMLVGAARHHPEEYLRTMNDFHDALDAYWDTAVGIPGYEPGPTKGGGNDKYYDDNAWLVISFAEAYQLTGRNRLIRRSYDTLTFVMSGWDDTLGGGIWWHERHKGNCKNTCANAPAAVGCLTLAKYRKDRRERMVTRAAETVAWTRKNLQSDNGLYMDSIHAETGAINRATLTYNSGLMLRAELMLHEATGDQSHLTEAKRIAAAADRLCHSGTSLYRDPPKWAHLMVEADLEFHRKTGDLRALERARANGDAWHKRWKEGQYDTIIDIASVARTLWLLADHETEVGRAFWKAMDERGR